ncbi:preprotein translocase subunit SecE [Gammaproteobacteria bacterium]|nr:preprotein translocase subunit SecE [Gammaproteobacteria bacterium]
MLVAFYFQYINLQAVSAQALYWAISALLLLISLRFTTAGQSFSKYLKLSKAEIKKVVWPSQKDVVVSTVAVGFAVVVISLMLALLDNVLVWLLSSITS